MAISDGHGLPLAVHVASASPHETKLVEPTLERRFLAEAAPRLIGDRAYDSDQLDARIRERFGVQLVAPHNDRRIRKATQDGRVLRRYRRRWKIERLFAWLHNFRRVVIRTKPGLPDLEHVKSAVIVSLRSPESQRSYRRSIDDFVHWYCSEPRPSFNKTVVTRYRIYLEDRLLAPGTINVRLAAVRRLAYEAADTGLLSPRSRRWHPARERSKKVGNAAWKLANHGGSPRFVATS